jgi:hypothetical protein
MTEFQIIMSSLGVIISGLTIAGAGIGAYVAVSTKLAVMDNKVGNLDDKIDAVKKAHDDHMSELHYHKRSTD